MSTPREADLVQHTNQIWALQPPDYEGLPEVERAKNECFIVSLLLFNTIRVRLDEGHCLQTRDQVNYCILNGGRHVQDVPPLFPDTEDKKVNTENSEGKQ